MIDITGSSDALGPTPMAVEGPARDEPFFLRGRRVRADGTESGGLHVAASGDVMLMGGCASTAPPAGQVRLNPGLVTRSWSDGATQRTWTALELPLLVWEYAGPQSATLTWRTPVAAGATIDRSGDGDFSVSHETGKRVRFIALGGALAAEPVGRAVEFRLQHSSSARLVAVAADDDADERRTIDRLARRGIAGLATQRTQHAAHLAALGPRLRTPEPAIDRAFGWAALLWGEAAAWTGAPSQVPFAAPAPGALERLREVAALLESRSIELLGPDPGRAASVLVDGVHGLFGVRPDAAHDALELAPALPDVWPSMALDRFRIGSAVLDVEVRRRPSATVVALRIRSGGPLSVAIGLPDVAVMQVDLDDVVMPAARARFEARHEHKLVFRHAE